MGLAKTRLGQHGYAWYVISTGDAANVKATCHEVQVAAFSKLSASVVEEPLNLGKSGPGTELTFPLGLLVKPKQTFPKSEERHTVVPFR
jgi:uncharacterized membrane protein